MKFLLFGTGKVAEEVMEGFLLSGTHIDVAGFLDNRESFQGQEFFGRTVYSPSQILYLEYDFICILIGDRFKEVYNQLVYGYHIPPDKVVDRFFLLKQMMMDKYKNDTRACVKDALSYWKHNKISFMNQYEYGQVKYDEVFWDTDSNMPYVYYGGKRMYYPRTYPGFFIKEDSLYAISYREMEQHELSPHRYLTDEIRILQGDVVIDAGAREGDFALPYIDIIGKLYLFECDPEWVRALQMTYKDYRDKVEIIPKMLSNRIDGSTTTLPDIVQDNRIDFIKMDIEGEEVNALSSAQELLKDNDIRCAICSYHRKNDQREIENIFKTNGYRCKASDGYVVFVADPCIFRDLDFRKGIVYARKCADEIC